MKILLTSTDVRALDSAVRSVMNLISADHATGVSIPVPSIAPRFSTETTISRRKIAVRDFSAALIENFSRSVLPSSVNITISI